MPFSRARLERGATAVALAQVYNLQPRTIKRLVAKGVDWSWHDGEEDAALPLLAAVQRGDRDYVRTLLDAGAPVDVHFKDGTCALGAAIDGAAMGGNATTRASSSCSSRAESTSIAASRTAAPRSSPPRSQASCAS